MNFLSNKIITLEPYSLDDIDLIYQWINDKDVSLYYPHNFCVSKDQLKRLIKSIDNNKEYLGYTIVCNNSSEKVGILEIRNIDMVARHCEIEIAIGNKKFQNRGIGEVTFKLAHNYIFNELGIEKVKLNTSFKNEKMKKLAEKLGYIQAGTLKNEWFINGENHDVLIYSKSKYNEVNAFDNVSELIGNTPNIKLNNYSTSNNIESSIYAKLEFLNPSGSVKDRSAFNIITEAFNRNEIKENSTLVAVTSGNLGVSLCTLSSKYKSKILIISPEGSIPNAKLQLINALGGKVIFTPGELSYEGSVKLCNKICNENKDYFNCNQFSNIDNVKAHEKTTSREIIRDFGSNIDTIILTIGSGGTITGIGKELKKINKNIKIIAVEPKECTVLSKDKRYDDHYILGIGPGFVPEILDENIIDEVITVTHTDAYNECVELARLEGIFCGMSSGAAMFAVKTYCKNIDTKENILTILPDNGIRYYHDKSIFNDFLDKKFDEDRLNKKYYGEL